MSDKITEKDKKFLARCLELAAEAVEAGDEAFGSVLVNEAGEIIAEARNRVNEKNVLAHPEIELAQWAAENLTAEEITNSTMYTSGEHCPMCAAAHGWVGIGTLVFLSSAAQLVHWQAEAGLPEANIEFIPAEKIIKNVRLRGPAEGEQLNEIKALHRKAWSRR